MFGIFGIVFFAVILGIIVAVYMTKRPPPGTPHVIPEEDFLKDPKDKTLNLEDLRRLTQALFKENGLTHKETIPESDHEEYWVGESQSPVFSGNYVFGLKAVTPEEPFVTMQEILQFKDFVKGIEKNKGFFLTTGYFVREVHQPLEGIPVTLYNKLRVLTELARRGL